jgi:hypothetical protein
MEGVRKLWEWEYLKLNTRKDAENYILKGFVTVKSDQLRRMGET